MTSSEPGSAPPAGGPQGSSAGGSGAPPPPASRDSGRTGTVIGLLLLWTFLFNIIIKKQGLVAAFFGIIDTLSEDVVMGSLITIVVGFGIVVVFTATKLYTQLISVAGSFRILERMVEESIVERNLKGFLYRLLHFHEERPADQTYPRHAASMMMGFSLLYVLSWIYLVLFSEALFFVSWSAGVDLPISDENLQLLPTLALSIPFSARVMAYFRYPYTQDYADFMPGAVFVLLLVASLGYLFESHDQKFFLLQVVEDPDYLTIFLRNGLILAFLPVFSEAVFWLVSLIIEEDAGAAGA